MKKEGSFILIPYLDPTGDQTNDRTFLPTTTTNYCGGGCGGVVGGGGYSSFLLGKRTIYCWPDLDTVDNVLSMPSIGLSEKR